MSTMLVISGFSTVPYAVVAGISALMEPSAALQELLTVLSSCEQVETTIVTVTATLGNLRWRRFRGDGDRTGRAILEQR